MVMMLVVIFSFLVDAQTRDYTQNYAGVTTGAGRYTANVSLSQDLYSSNTVSVSGISSNISGDYPASDNYNTLSRVLTIGGLRQSQTRTLSVTYDIENPSLPAGVVTFLTIVIWFFIFVILGLLVGAVVNFFQS